MSSLDRSSSWRLGSKVKGLRKVGFEQDTTWATVVPAKLDEVFRPAGQPMFLCVHEFLFLWGMVKQWEFLVLIISAQEHLGERRKQRRCPITGRAAVCATHIWHEPGGGGGQNVLS